MARTQHNDDDAQNQVPDDFYGDEAAENRTVDTTSVVKTISAGYCAFLPERAIVAKGKTLLGRIGGTMFGVDFQLRNVKDHADKGYTPETHPEAFGRAMVGDFNADRFNDDGSIDFFEGGFCYLPGGFQERALARFQQLSDEEKSRGMTFSAFIFAEPAGNPRGFRYVLENAMRVVQDERMLVTRLRREALLVQKMRADTPLISDQRARTVA